MICNYSWKYGKEPKGETEEKNVAEDFIYYRAENPIRRVGWG